MDILLSEAFMTHHQYKLEAENNSYKVTESLGLEKAFKVTEPNFWPNTTIALIATPNYLLNTSRHDDSTTSLDGLFQCLPTLSVKKLFMSNLNLP